MPANESRRAPPRPGHLVRFPRVPLARRPRRGPGASLGHRVIAKFAERHLADKARAEIKALLEPGESLADCSTWADECVGRCVKRHLGITSMSRWRSSAITTNGRARKAATWSPKIRELEVVLKDRSKTVEERRFALRFLVHLIEDLHMPMHVGENHDKGGNQLQVRFFDQGRNLHRSGTPASSAGEPNEDRWSPTSSPWTRRGPGGRAERLRRGLGHREPAGGPGSLQDPATGQRISRGQAGRCLPGAEPACSEASALSGRGAAGVGAQRGVGRVMTAASSEMMMSPRQAPRLKEDDRPGRARNCVPGTSSGSAWPLTSSSPR